MRRTNLNTVIGLALGLGFSACDLSQVESADAEATQPATAATIVGVWRTNIPVTTTNPPTDIKVTMEVDAAGTMILSQRVATGQPHPIDFLEISNEKWTWSVSNGNMVSLKTSCTYIDPATMQPSTTCTEPMSKSAAINVKGTAWTVVENGQPIVFRKD